MKKRVNRGGRYRERGEAEVDSHFKKDELRIEEDMVISDGNWTRLVNQKELPLLAPAPHRKKLLHSEGHLVQWERFLPIKSLKVLLVENDHCTLQVVSALLRNCSYEVTAAGNGLEAWKILEDSTNHYDLVLTEVIMPGLSGIDLLCKIMNHKTLKNIPVIMMSSHDPMGIVFKCLSKGAVDFLVKPIRKNELKNLWQHVWRRCHISSDSESGVQAERSLKSNGHESNNNIGSNDEDRNASINTIIKDGSDSGSGSQACEGKQIHDNISKEENPKLQGSFSGKNVSFLNENLPPNITESLMEEKSVNDSKKNNHQLNEDLMEFDGRKHSAHEADVIGIVDSNSLTPNKLASTRDGGTATINEYNILRHSDVSAFSRYITCAGSAVSNHIRTEYGANYSSPVDSSSETAKTKVFYSPPLKQGSNDSGSNNNYMKCTTNNATTYSEKSVVKATHVSAFHPVQSRSTATSDVIQEKINDFKTVVKVAWPKPVHPHVQQVQGRQQSQNQSGQDESNVNVVSSSAPQYVSSNCHSVVPEDYNTGDNINKSGSSSINPGSNGNTGFTGDSGFGTRNGTNENRCWSAQREAALNKFRQKRKDRCFKKKVRYQNRKKLAEQRPRVRGQFVRRVHGIPNVL